MPRREPDGRSGPVATQIRDHRTESDWNTVVREATLAIATETMPEAVLGRIADLAREVDPARYAVLCVTGESEYTSSSHVKTPELTSAEEKITTHVEGE